MSTPTLIVMVIFMALVIGAMIIMCKHMQVMKRYVAAHAEMKHTVGTLNAALLAAQATLADYRKVVHGQAEASAPSVPILTASNDAAEARPARSPRRDNKIAQMASTLTNQSQARS